MPRKRKIPVRFVLFSLLDGIRTKIKTYTNPMQAWEAGQVLGKGNYSINAEHKLDGVWIMGGAVSFDFGSTAQSEGDTSV